MSTCLTIFPVTKLEIVASALKIGLGALITGLTSIIVTQVTHKKEIEKEVRQRRREILDEIARQFEIPYRHVLP